MLKVKIWEKGTTDECSLRLVENDDTIDIVVVDKNGDPYDSGYVVGISSYGYVERYEHIEDDLVDACGFMTSEENQLADLDANVIPVCDFNSENLKTIADFKAKAHSKSIFGFED